MSSGYPTPGGPAAPEPPSWSPVPAWPGFAPPPDTPSYGPPLSDHDLRRLPPPVPTPPTHLAAPAPRPGVVAVAATLAVTASLQWLCALSLLWVTATVGASGLGQQGEEGAVFHILNRFDDRMLDGLAWPLYGFPLVSFVTGFLILSGRWWSRVVHSAVGAAAIAWSAFWLRDDLVWWFSSAVYVLVACGILWTPAATRWFSRSRRTAQPS